MLVRQVRIISEAAMRFVVLAFVGSDDRLTMRNQCAGGYMQISSSALAAGLDLDIILRTRCASEWERPVQLYWFKAGPSNFQVLWGLHALWITTVRTKSSQAAHCLDAPAAALHTHASTLPPPPCPALHCCTICLCSPRLTLYSPCHALHCPTPWDRGGKQLLEKGGKACVPQVLLQLEQ